MKKLKHRNSKKAPKAKAKKTVKKSAPKKRGTASHADAFKQWQGGVPVLSLCQSLGIHSGHTLTKIFIALAGSKDSYLKMRKAGAGGGHIPFGGKPFVRTKSEPNAPRAMDKNVKHVTFTNSKNGWKREWLRTDYAGYGVHPIHIAPDGTRYVQAKETERADLVVDFNVALPPYRMRKYETSSVLKKLNRAEKLVKKGAKVQKLRKKIRQAKARRNSK